jgi:hypothetical protein
MRVSTKPLSPSWMTVGSSVVASPTMGMPTIMASMRERPRLV